ncbi:NAD/NADP octopine/nopaline dehydrogenase family protein [bacterium]|nr:NAD/NADP octopine/nopaline dehydrogenase family protein [bacterium]MCB2179047.1 NAD/NADP octopine/nopaline dehydrogenase family protein [bacterium]
MKIKDITVIGAGHGGKAMAAHLGLMGANVTLYNRTSMKLDAIRLRGGISLTSEQGNPQGFGKLCKVTDNMREALEASRLIMVVVPAFAHKEIAEKMAPWLRDDHIVVLNPGRTFGAMAFSLELRKHGCPAKLILAEAQTFVYASRSIGPAQAFIHRIKDAVPLAAYPATYTDEVLEVLSPYYPQFIDGKTVLETGLNNIGAVFHPTITLANTGRIESTGGKFDFYTDGVTPTVAKMMEAIDRERMRVGKALGVQLISACAWLDLAYASRGEDLHQAIHNQPGYRGIQAPGTLNHRYIKEDIPMSLVPMASLGRKLGIRVRGMESIIRLACIAHDVDYWQIGRTMESLQIKDLSPEEILAQAVGLPKRYISSEMQYPVAA